MTLKLKSSFEGDFIVKRFVSSRRIRRQKRRAKRSSYAQDIAKTDECVRVTHASRRWARASRSPHTPATRPPQAATVLHATAVAVRGGPNQNRRVARRVQITPIKGKRSAECWLLKILFLEVVLSKSNTHTHTFHSLDVIGQCSETLARARDAVTIGETGFATRGKLYVYVIIKLFPLYTGMHIYVLRC